MKRFLLFNIVILIALNSNAQSLTTVDINTNENGKSGNYKDILASMFQLASTNLAGDQKSIEFNATLFALKAKANKGSTVNYNNYRQKFERNFQFNFKIQLDSVFKYDGFNGGITYAIVNQRDKHLANFANTLLHQYFDELSNEIQGNQLALLVRAGYTMPDISTTIAKMLRAEPETNFDANESPIRTILLTNLDNKLFVQAKPLADGTSIANTTQMIETLSALRTQYYTDMESKILWTVTADGSASSEGKFNKAAIGSIFLKGNKEAWNELDIRAKFTYADTLLAGLLPRTAFNAQAGMNFKIAKDTQQQSFFEIKIYGEYNSVLNNALPDEEKNIFLANADIRLRVTDDLWFPITIKYDTENANFFGFLNVTYNFGGI